MPTWPTITDGVTRLSNALFGLIKTYIDDSLTGQGLPSGGATGDLLQKNSATNYDAGWTDSPTVDALTLDTAAAEATGVAKLYWDTQDVTAALGLNANITYHLGAQELVRVSNRTGTAIAAGKAVYILGAHGDRPEVALADASTEATAATTLGITAESIADSDTGYVCVSGLLRNLDTNHLTVGQLVWLSETAGELTSTRPTQPAHGVFMGLCVKQGPGTSGILYVSVVNGLELEELHDVLISGVAAGDLLKRNAGNTLWVNAAPAALTTTDDTNVTLTLGGNASTALVNAASLTAGWTGQLALARGGTGASTQQGALNAIAGAVTSGQYLRGDGTNVTLAAIQAGDVPTLNQNTTGSAATLTTTRTLWGQNFNGSANVTGALSNVGSVTFTGTGNRISGDFTTATIADRLAFQTSTANSNASVAVLPNGTGIAGQFLAYGNSTPTNASYIGIVQIGTTESRLQAAYSGSGTYTPLTFYTGGVERARIDTSGNVGIGVTPTLGILHAKGVIAAEAPTAGADFAGYFRPSGAASAVDNSLVGLAGYGWDGSASQVGATINFRAAETWSGTARGTYIQFRTVTAGSTTLSEKVRIDSSGNVGIGTSSPSARLHVVGVAGSTTAFFNQANAGKTGILLAENGVARGYLSQVGLYSGTTDGNFGIFVETGYNFQIATNGSVAAKLTVETSGVVTLASNLNLTAGQINFGAGPVGALYMSSSRLRVRSESTDDVANFASYGMYLSKTGQTAGLYVESPIEARGGLRMGNSAANGTITYGATVSNVANRLVERDGSGHIYYQYGFGAYHNQSSGNSENPTISQFWTQSSADNYARKSSAQHVINQLGLVSNYGTSYYQANTWLQFNGNYGSYWPSATGWASAPHLWPSTSQSYGSLELQGVKNSYAGLSILDTSSRRHYLMGESGNFGLLLNNSTIWAMYYYAAGNNIGYGGSTTTSGYSHTFSGAAWFRNAVYVDNSFTATGTKSFDITHPVAPTKRLRYAAIEGPRVDVLHRGVATVSGHAVLDLDAEAQLLPGTSAALMRDLQCQLTNLSEIFCQLRGRLDGTTLHIYTDSPEPITVAWLVLGERQDDEIKATTGTDADGRLISEYDADPTIGQHTDHAAAVLQQE